MLVRFFTALRILRALLLFELTVSELFNDFFILDPHVDDDRSFTDFEFSRLEFDPSVWRITELNSDYRFCSTYPKFWIVPASIGDQEIESAGRYRSLRRVPSIVWR